jgi:hypothetical protein
LLSYNQLFTLYLLEREVNTMLRRFLRFIGFYALAAYAVLEEDYIKGLIKKGYLKQDAYAQNKRLEVTRMVLTKLKKEY